jgi:hypothetical protein
MPDVNQVPPPDRDPPSHAVPPAEVPAETAAPEVSSFEPLPPEPLPPDRSDERGLAIWLVIVTSAFVASVVFQQGELGLLTALGGMFAVAHAVDRDPRWTLLHSFLAWIPPVGGAIGFAGLAWYLNTVGLPVAERWVGIAFAGVGAVVSMLLAIRPITDALARAVFRDQDPGHTERLAARLIALGFLFCVPGWLVMKGLADSEGLDSIVIGASSFIGSLIGFTLLSLGGVGYPITRGFRATCERLGLRRFQARDILLTFVGLVAILLLNVVVEWIAQRFAPGAWARDQAMNEMIAGRLTRSETLMLGISAGVGEELAMRGALQPRFGLFATSLLFAVLHVQYSWIGILTITVLGMVLGWIRKRGSTSTAIAVHVLYDIVAALGIQDQTGR